MQYVLKLTPLGVKHHIFRVVSIDGMADVEHVLNLCNLSFDYGYYEDKALYFAKDQAAFKTISIDVDFAALEDTYGPTGNEFKEFWLNELDLEQISLEKVDLLAAPSLAIGRFDELLERMDLLAAEGNESARALTSMEDHHPEDHRAKFKFIYVQHGVQHLVEVMTSSQKLKCFLPATLMGEGLVIDTESKLSPQMLNDCLDAHADDDSLNLKDCTSRMRALGAMRGDNFINQAVINAGATPLKFKSK